MNYQIKRFFTLILLFIFLFEPICIANTVMQRINGIDGKPTSISKELSEKIKPYEENNKRVIENSTKEINYQKTLELAKYSYYYAGKKDSLNFDTIKNYEKNPVHVINLQNDNYILYDYSSRYALEFDKNDSCVGVVKIKCYSSKEEMIVFYEYKSDSISNEKAYLKHIVIAYNDSHKALFVYDKDEKMLAFGYDYGIYAIDALFPEDVLRMQAPDFHINTIKTTKKEKIINTTALAITPIVPAIFIGALAIMAIGGPIEQMIHDRKRKNKKKEIKNKK